MKLTAIGIALAIVASGGGQAAAETTFGPGFQKSDVAEFWYVFGSLTPTNGASDFDCYEFSPGAGERFLLELDSREFDTVLQVGRGRGCNWTASQSDDDSGDGSNAKLEIVGDGSPWSIRARSYDGAGGSYSLYAKWRGTVGSVASIRLGQTVEGAFAAGDATDQGAYFDCYSFTVSAGRSVSAQLTGGYPGRLALFAGGECGGDELGSALAMPEASVQVALPAAGEYSVQAHAMAIDAPGPYRLSLR